MGHWRAALYRISCGTYQKGRVSDCQSFLAARLVARVVLLAHGSLTFCPLCSRDEDDGVLEKVEAEAEKFMRAQVSSWHGSQSLSLSLFCHIVQLQLTTA